MGITTSFLRIKAPDEFGNERYVHFSTFGAYCGDGMQLYISHNKDGTEGKFAWLTEKEVEEFISNYLRIKAETKERNENNIEDWEWKYKPENKKKKEKP